MNASSYLSFDRRDVLAALLIIAIAFAYRVAIIWDRAVAPDNAGYFDPLPEGSDQKTYYATLFQYRDGDYPPPTFHYQPGISYFLIGLTSLLGTTSLGVLRLALAAFASINCGLMYAVARLAFGNRRISLMAAGLLALYPVGAFYDTDMVITSQGIILLTIALFGALWMYRVPQHWMGAVLLGCVIGIGAITRLEIAVAAMTLSLWLCVIRWRKYSLVPFILTISLALVFILPVALHNRAGGADFLITPVGATEIYRGFNRDASGIYAISRADVTTHFDYYSFLAQDIRLEPLRFIELVLRKLGLFFSATEPGNNLDYAAAGEAVSIGLRLNPLDFRILLVLTAFGMVALWHDHRPVLFAFLMICAAMSVMTMLIWVEARIRAPIIAALIPCAAYGLYDLAAHFPQAAFWRQRLPLIVTLVVGLILAWVAEYDLPRKVTVAELPANAESVNALYNDELRLVGYRIEDQYSARGVFQPFRPYVVSLYWKLERPTTINYSFALKYVVGDEALDQFDHPIGYVNYPQRPTSQWETNRMYVEHIGMGIRRFDVPTEISGHLWLEVYPERRFTEVFEPTDGGSTQLELARPAVAWGEGQPFSSKLDDAAQDDLHFGDLLVLKAWNLPAEGQPGEIITLTTGWQTTAVQIQDSYIIGVYLQSEAGEYPANFDSPPRNGDLLTSSLPPQYRLEDQRSLTLPEQPGTYRVYIAVYRQNNGERLALRSSGETLALIGSVRVK